MVSVVFFLLDLVGCPLLFSVVEEFHDAQYPDD
jgi:hypothetical protein